MEPYTFADLEKRDDLIADIRRLESLMQKELGKGVTLIAYTQEEAEEANV